MKIQEAKKTLLRLQVLLIVFFGMIFSGYSANYFWVGGAGNWNDLTHWSNTTGGVFPSTDKVQVPQSTDDVFFDANSGFTINQTAVLTTTSTCHDITFTSGVTGAGISGSQRLDIYGSVILENGMSPFGGTGSIYFLSSGVETITSNGAKFGARQIYFEPFNGAYTIIDYFDQDYFNSRMYVDPGGTGAVHFQDTAHLGRYLYLESGVLTFDKHVFGKRLVGAIAPGETYYEFYADGGRVNYLSSTQQWVYARASIGPVFIDMKNNTHELHGLYAPNTGRVTIDFSGSILNNHASWSIAGSNETIISTNSTINMLGDWIANMSLELRDYVYNNVNVYRDPWRMQGYNASIRATVDSLVFYTNFSADKLFVNIGVGGSGLLEFKPSGIYSGQRSTSTYRCTFYINSGTAVKMLGNCQDLVAFQFVDFNFTIGSAPLLNSDYVRLDNSVATGPDVPYNAGPNSYQIPGSTNTGWTIPVPVARTLYWQGPIPSGETNTWEYGHWNDCNNWSANPAANPQAPIASCACPPLYIDNVIFPDSSYVRIENELATCKDMIWLQDGILYDTLDYDRQGSHVNTKRRLEIYGSLTFSLAMKNQFEEDIYFRAWEAYPTITSNQKNINFRAIFEGTGVAAKWTLLDTFRVAQPYPNSPTIGYNYWGWQLRKGYFNANGQTIFSWGLYTVYANGPASQVLDIQNSQVYFSSGTLSQKIQDRAHGAATFQRSDYLQIKTDNSHIHYTGDGQYWSSTSTLNPLHVSAGGHTFNDITFYGNQMPFMRMDGVSSLTDSANVVTFKNSGKIYIGKGKLVIRKLITHEDDANANTFEFFHRVNASANSEIDSAIFNGSASFGMTNRFNNLLYLAPSKTYDFTTNNETTTLSNASVLDANATCETMITIRGGQFFSTGDQSADYCLIDNNTASTATFTATNSVLAGVTTGWTAGPSAGRTLYWYDGIVGNSSGRWESKLNWSTTAGALTPLDGNCPPTRYDTVIFVQSSFNGLNDTVIIDLGTSAAECADMRWLNDNSVNPIMVGPQDQQLNIFYSLEFASSMQQEFLGEVHFKYAAGGAKAGVGDATIKSNGQQFNWHVYFDGDNGAWQILDYFQVGETTINTVPRPTMYLNQGTFKSNDFDMRLGDFFSQTTDTRRIELGASEVAITRPGHWRVANAGYSIDGGTSNIRFEYGAICRLGLGAHKYYDITFPLQGTVYAGDDTIHNIYFNHNSTIYGQLNTGSGYTGVNVINKICNYSTGSTININSYNKIDSVDINSTMIINSDNNIEKYIKFHPNRTYTFGAGKTQHIANGATVDAISFGGNEFTWNSTVNGSESYIRRDSGFVCTDYLYMRDIHAIGDGVSTSTSCTLPECDTVINDSYIPSFKNSGRAVFAAGVNANDQGNNKGWDFSPYPPTPTVDLPTPDKDVCSNELITVTFEIEGVEPVYFTYDSAGVEIDTVLTTPGFGIGSEDLSGSGTAADPFIWAYQFNYPSYADSVVIQSTDVTYQRCFVGAPNVAGDVKFTWVCWDPLPVELLHFYAVKEEKTSLLNWETASETNNAYFDIQRSADGSDFRSIGRVEGAGNSTQNIAYSFIDEHPHPAKNYYRLQQVDFNGDSEVSQVETVYFDGLGNVTIYPNPANDVLNIETNLKEVSVIIRDVSGKMIFSRDNFSESQTINLSDFAAGSYWVEIIDKTTAQRTFKKLEIID